MHNRNTILCSNSFEKAKSTQRLKMIKKVRSTSFQKFIVLTTSVLAFGTIAHAAPIELTMQHMEQPPSRVEAMQVVVDKFNEW